MVKTQPVITLRQVNFEYFILRSNISNVQPCFCKNFGVTQVINKLKGGAGYRPPRTLPLPLPPDLQLQLMSFKWCHLFDTDMFDKG